ncbi:shikimate dehydrogenase [Desulfomonile tiedjei]|uniref:Shikimate dehydrogenase (NADP(+)) n=1 Tax=Desulfomonile tiedjei (strain ATCC 49306 / DSM 6799 / DCB-1) TaxID=706587 RepID=I4C398_DESTA|nr:shikimate dehydrogenase [Desulfomonile tiedjei]AFM24039.1 shikimate dehydrogenase [Desulfomonile tiedjei DSM 6799]
MVKGTTNLVGIIGFPVSHSLSPTMHNAAFRALNMDWKYVPLSVRPQNVPDALKGLIALGFRGANVTVPHKEKVTPYLNDISADAQQIGAVNTILVQEDTLSGFNTDWSGFLNHLTEIGFDPSGAKALILGSGGSARAVSYSLCQRGADISILSRNTGTAGLIIDELSSQSAQNRIGSISAESLRDSARDFDLVVNTTPLGMTPLEELSPWPHDIGFPRRALAYDLVYNPAKTRFLEIAEDSGALAVNGLGMLVHQAAEAFKIWTDREAPVHVMKEAILSC